MRGGSTSVASDSTAPLSPSPVLQQIFCTGMPAGISTCNDWYTFPQPAREVYMLASGGNPKRWVPSSSNENFFLVQPKPIHLLHMSGTGPQCALECSIRMATIDNSHLSGFLALLAHLILRRSVCATEGMGQTLNFMSSEARLQRLEMVFSATGNGVLARDINMN